MWAAGRLPLQRLPPSRLPTTRTILQPFVCVFQLNSPIFALLVVSSDTTFEFIKYEHEQNLVGIKS
jgi:hypothetical protein